MLISRVTREFIISTILCYKYIISPLLPSCCRFYPSCSTYALTALTTKPLHNALFLTAKRILRCNPFSKGGFDFLG